MGAKNNFGIDCPACDEPQILPILPEGECQDLPSQSEICGLYFAGTELPTDWTTAAGWAGIVDNSDTTGAKTKYLIGRGSKGEPEETEIEGAKEQNFVIRKESTIEFEVLNPQNLLVRAFLDQLNCGTYKPNVWFETLGCCLIGGDSGIPIKTVKVTFPYESGRDAYKKAFIRLTYSCTQEPPITENPLA